MALTFSQMHMLEKVARPPTKHDLGIGNTNRTAAALVRLGLIERDTTREGIGYFVHYKPTAKGRAAAAKEEQ